VEMHGGRITVESQVDVGTIFTTWLPLADDADQNPAAE
jgi:signal transduction histidine kinase